MESFFEKVLEFLASAQGASVTIAIILDFAFRLIPSEKPRSLIYMVAHYSKKLGDLLVKIGNFLDKILPQKIK